MVRVESRSVDEPTLANLLRASAFAHLPTRFYQLLQLALPLSAQMWAARFPRLAGWLIVVSAFGIWALCEQRLEREAWAVDVYGRAGAPSSWLRAARGVVGAGAVALAGGLAVEGVVWLMSLIYRCPRCAG